MTTPTTTSSLVQQINQLKRDNEVLFNCWQAAEQKASKAIAKYLSAAREADSKDAIIKDLETQLLVYQHHLNPR